MKTFIDYLRFRFTASPFQALEVVRSAVGFVTPDLVDLGGSEKGKDGWQHRRPIILGGDEILGYVDYGGESQRGWSRWDMSGLAVPGLIAGISWPSLCHPSAVSCGGSMSL